MKDLRISNPTDYNNVKELIYSAADQYGEKAAFVIKEKKDKEVNYINISYKKLLEDVNNYGTGLYCMNLKDKRVAVIGKNRYEWALAHVSNLVGGIVSVPLDKDLQLEELENSLIRSKADAIVFDTKLIDMIREIKKNGKTQIREYICMDKNDEFICVEEIRQKGEEALKNGNKDYINCEIDSNKVGVLLFTSGTTSQSKAVMLSQRNITSNIYALQCVEDIRSTDTNIAFLPFHHIFGSTCMVMMLSYGVRTVFPDGLKYIKQNMQEYKVSVFVGVPLLTEAMYKAIVKEVARQGKTELIKKATKVSNFLLKLHIDIRRKLFKQILDGLGGELRLVITGGAAADPVSITGFNDIGVTTLQGYGLSETSPVIVAECKKARRIGSVGFPMINDTVEIVNKDEDGIGEIRVKGPNVMLGYYEMPELTAETIKDGWLYTGDLGYHDKDGYLFLTGRRKNMIVLKNGKKVFPEEIESLINRLDLVEESIVFGLEDEQDKNDVMLTAKIVYDENAIKEKYEEKSEEELYNIVWEQIKELNTTFPRYKHIQKLIVSHEELIKTTTKKVKRQEEIKRIMSTNLN
ncbi:MAG: AMP-binding protein [Clostridia bacterium]|nr:AMP-binding protein [Clostridia bacterium]